MYQIFTIFAAQSSTGGNLLFVFIVFIGVILFIVHRYFSTQAKEKIHQRAQELFTSKYNEIEEIINKLLAERTKFSEELSKLKSDYKTLQKEKEDLQRRIQLHENKDPSYEKVAEYLEKNEGYNTVLFVTGNAGSGKSYIIEHLALRLKGCVLLAPTGVAASIIHGATIHSFFKLPPKLLDKADIKNAVEKVKDKINIIKYLLIDEISMVSAYTMDCIDEILRKAKNTNKAFGGIKLVVAGDLYQLPPVITKEYVKILNLKRKKNGSKYDYFFKADVFREMKIEMLFLEDQHRTDKELAFATTVHKAQGKTIDKVYYDGTNPFASGQTYVGLSRTKRLEDLTLKYVIKDIDIIFDESVKYFYKTTERIKL